MFNIDKNMSVSSSIKAKPKNRNMHGFAADPQNISSNSPIKMSSIFCSQVMSKSKIYSSQLLEQNLQTQDSIFPL